MLTPLQSLLTVFFILQSGAMALLLVAYSLDFETFSQVITGRWAIIPRLRKSANLFRLSRKAGFQIVYLFSGIFTLFSYVVFILMVVYTLGWSFGLL